MMKNYHLVKEAEAVCRSNQKLSLEERLKLVDEMYLFSEKFEKGYCEPECSPHVKMLIKLTDTFKRLRNIKNA
jgi:hypothetical protein